MIAKYQTINSIWLKICSKCKHTFNSQGPNIESLKAFFTNDKRKLDGLDCVCRQCRKIYRDSNKSKETARWSRNVAPGSPARKRHIVRSSTRKKFGTAKKQKCFYCQSSAKEWHHFKYTVSTVIPLCGPCHYAIPKLPNKKETGL